MNPKAAEIVSKLWKECRTLQSAGVSYSNYVNELTYLLFLKMLEETGQGSRLPNGHSWSKLAGSEGGDQLQYYKAMLHELGNPKLTKDPVTLAIFTNAITHLRLPKDLKTLTSNIDALDWFSTRADGLGDLYEGLLEKTTSTTKCKAGQYFTPRALIDCIIRLVKPEPGEVIQDPAAGTGGFLIAADRYIKDATDELLKLTDAERHFQQHQAFVGQEWVPDTHRLCVMNMLLHGIECLAHCGDSCAPQGKLLGRADVVLTNPPFNKMSSCVNRPDFTLTAGERIGPMSFLEHVIRSLKRGGRCAMVMPDNILFGNGIGAELRRFLMANCNLHTILRLPTGIFYAQGVKTNVLFFSRATEEIRPAGSKEQATTEVWFYDLRTNMPSFGKTNTLTAEHFKEFEELYGSEPLGNSKRQEQGEGSRWRMLTREKIAERGDNLDWIWLREESSDSFDGLTDLDEIAAAIKLHLITAIHEIKALTEELEDVPQAEDAG